MPLKLLRHNLQLLILFLTSLLTLHCTSFPLCCLSNYLHSIVRHLVEKQCEPWLALFKDRCRLNQPLLFQVLLSNTWQKKSPAVASRNKLFLTNFGMDEHRVINPLWQTNWCHLIYLYSPCIPTSWHVNYFGFLYFWFSFILWLCSFSISSDSNQNSELLWDTTVTSKTILEKRISFINKHNRHMMHQCYLTSIPDACFNECLLLIKPKYIRYIN